VSEADVWEGMTLFLGDILVFVRQSAGLNSPGFAVLTVFLVNHLT